MFNGPELPASDTPWRWESKTVDVESEVRKALLEERMKIVKILRAAQKRYGHANEVINLILDDVLEMEPK